MGEAEKAGVEAETTCGITFGTIFFISDNGTTYGGELDAELMAASSFEGEFDKGAVTVLAEHTVVGDGVAGEGGCGANRNLEGVGLVEIGFEGARWLRQMALDDRFILFLKGIPVSLKDLFRVRCFCKNHQA